MKKIEDLNLKTLKMNQRCYWCDFCEPKTTKAVYRSAGFHDFACVDHKDKLQAKEDAEKQAEYSEADFQTWLRW